jgi:Na+/melibiose symporter-like transporter
VNTETANTEQPPQSRRRKVSKRTKLGFASGMLENSMMTAAGLTTMLFYNQVLGVAPELCGLAFAIASVVDAVSDPLVGLLSDRVRTRWGRRHPFMLGSSLPLGLFFYLMYQPPSGLSEVALFWWFTITMVGMRLAKTFYTVPHAALGSELTDDYDERTSIFGWNWSVMVIGGVLLTSFVGFVIFPSGDEYYNGFLNPNGYEFLAIFGGLTCFLAVVFCSFMTADQIPYLHSQTTLQNAIRTKYSELALGIWNDIKGLATNLSYLSVVFCWLILAISGGVLGVAGTYAFVYGFEFTSEEIAFREWVKLPGALLCVAFAAYLVKQIDKKYTVILMILVTTFLVGLPYCLRLIGWFPENDPETFFSSSLFIAIFCIWILGFITLPVVPIVIDSQLVDIADEHELNTGNRSEALIMAVRTFSVKVSDGLGGMIGGFWLAFIDFPKNASPETLTQEHLDQLFFMMGPLYYIIVYAGLGFCFMYRISRSRHEEILRELEKRRLEASG